MMENTLDQNAPLLARSLSETEQVANQAHTTYPSETGSTPVEPAIAHRRLKVLLLVEQCNPDWTSVPLIGYRLFHEISQLVDVTLVTHERNRAAIEQQQESAEIIYIPESHFAKRYYELLSALVERSKVIWPLYHSLGYPIYEEFNHRVYQRLKARVLNHEYDIVHALTPMQPRYPIKLIKACKTVPFLLGPVNGGVPFPAGFRQKAKQEFVYLNFLRQLGRWLVPGYAETYKKANRVLVGSIYTLNMLKEMFQLPSDRAELFYENGILTSFLNTPSFHKSSNSVTNLLFVGRLVPYKSADILIEAIDRLDTSIKARLRLTIVGDGSEREPLTAQVQKLGLENQIQFSGWVSQAQILKYYQEADIFCFPSIREFGGAVVLEAMACGLPCIVANNGGIGEYVTEKTGFKIDPISREYLTQELANKIQILVEDESLRQEMSANAIKRVREFTWQRKAQKIVDTYHELIASFRAQLQAKC